VSRMHVTVYVTDADRLLGKDRLTFSHIDQLRFAPYGEALDLEPTDLPPDAENVLVVTTTNVVAVLVTRTPAQPTA
jgi:hypothetical protein